MIPLHEAMVRILADVHPVASVEVVPLARALGRVLAEDLYASIDVPPWDNSAMDGYAVRREDASQVGAQLRVTQRIAAGSVGPMLSAGTAARIFTGAPLPDHADAVLMQENAKREGDQLICLQAVECGENVRPRGQDIGRGDCVFKQGRRLLPQDLGVLASQGLAEVSVHPKLMVGILSTGDELQEPGQPLQPGQIYNSNRYTLMGLLQGLGIQWRDYGRVPDDRVATERVLRQAALESDVIISSGGVSVGEEDHVRAAVESLGELSVWKLAIKPGKPLAYGRVCEVPFFGLPGNPAATFVTFGLAVKPYLKQMLGDGTPPLVTLPARADFSWGVPGRRREYLRAKLKNGENGEPTVALLGNQSSGILSLVSEANCLVVMPIGATCEPGDKVAVVMMSEWLN